MFAYVCEGSHVLDRTISGQHIFCDLHLEEGVQLEDVEFFLLNADLWILTDAEDSE